MRRKATKKRFFCAKSSDPAVVRLNRDYLRADNTVWVYDPDATLGIRDVSIVLQDAHYAYIDEGLSDGDRVVTTDLSTIARGAPLRTEGEEDGAADQ